MSYSVSRETVLQLQETELSLYSFLRQGTLFTATADAPCTPCTLAVPFICVLFKFNLSSSLAASWQPRGNTVYYQDRKYPSAQAVNSSLPLA